MSLKKGSKSSQAARNIRSVYKNEALSIRTCQRWFKQFESGNFTLEDSLRSGRPSSVPLKILTTVVEKNPKQPSQHARAGPLRVKCGQCGLVRASQNRKGPVQVRCSFQVGYRQ